MLYGIRSKRRGSLRTRSYKPAGLWTATHQMTMNGKRDGLTLADFEACARSALMKRGRAAAILDEMRAAVEPWPACTEGAGVDEMRREQVGGLHRMVFATG